MTDTTATAPEHKAEMDRFADLASYALRILADAALGGRTLTGRIAGLALHFAYGIADRLPPRSEARADLERRFGNGTRDIVEEGSWESFPASDPPSTMPPRAG